MTLQQIAERGFDRALGAGIDLELIGDRSVVRQAGVGTRQKETRAASP